MIVADFRIESKRYTFFLSVDNKNSYGVQNDDYLRILAIYSVLHRMYKKRNKREARNLSCWKKRK